MRERERSVSDASENESEVEKREVFVGFQEK